MTGLSIRWKLTLWYGVVLTGVLVVFSTAVYYLNSRQSLAKIDYELDEELQELRLEIELAKDSADLQTQLQRRFTEHAMFEFLVSRPDGSPLFYSRHLDPRHLPRPDQHGLSAETSVYRMVELQGREYRVATRLARGPRSQLIVQSITSMIPYRRSLADLLLLLLTVGPLGVATALGGGYWLARQALDPVDRMTAAAELITIEQLDRRLEVANPNDELGRLARTLNRMIGRLHASVEELRRFTADAAHELRTPLAVLRTEVEVALRAPRSSEVYHQVVQVTLQEVTRLARLTDQLLLLSRQDGGLQRAPDDDVQLDALLCDVIDQIRPRAEQQQIAIDGQLDGEWVVRGDDIRLSQVLFNLLDNGIKYNRQGGRILIRGQIAGNRGRIVIEDTGQGIPAADIPHVFQRFYRVDQSRNRERGGIGLGLAICRSVVEAHGGTISLVSTPGTGTQVTVELPLVPGGNGEGPGDLEALH